MLFLFLYSSFIGLQLSISLCHSTGEKKNQRASPEKPKPDDHLYVLEHNLHQMMREVRRKSVRVIRNAKQMFFNCLNSFIHK